MADFYNIKVADIYKETKDTVVITFDIPENLKEKFKFKQGQHLTLRKEINGEDIRRNYSLCTSPIDNEWKVAVKTIRNGVFSNYAFNELKKGDELQVMPPHGEFYVEIDKKAPNNYVAFAAGSGITPMLSIIKTHLLLEPKSTFKLFYLNRMVKSIIFKEELEQLKNQFFGRFQVFYFLTKEKRDIPFLNGRFDKEKLAVLTKTFIDIPDTNHAFICGPQDMIFLIRDELQAAGLDIEKIHYELFFSGSSEEENKHIAEVIDEKADGTKVTIIDGGKEFHFVMDDDFDNILDGALSAGADLPFACKGGVCSTCKCKVLEGEVKMKVNYALEEKEVAQNFVLSCQAVPVTEKVVVDFDV
ncbi:phenylacetate-CoA oxygenase/reductase subunit PaaK [Flavobacteriaceae bacterium S0825]|uniref:1,2-phenylacetyl-CoA epoxidase subunit PaaE n=1 Tax=Gaetbulibacter sp. S0825 TaxID=2720084 RepID=UPI00142F4075|nr:1,2-phenylacetyl-CoA epoxidase subunit PaaE [Gaetbulibacter sp. S0825]MCK0108718.1 phenylacetate-CoA oxygenase/reductase subunit PaaK [Flavobacteriaceae bacterium S0825]NIX64354.1 phenylacetate-CoA oxygenase/reductase subunit PaaK [Gaetbulibacter sp. S0825]